MNNTNWVVDNSTIALYLQACKEAAEDDSKFAVFKRDPRYTPVLEHVSKEEAELFIQEMKNCDITETQWREFLDNDLLGTPRLEEFGRNYNQSTISPSTVRYIKQALDIYNFFGVIEGNIVEIGGGYGGLCKTLSVLNYFKHYSIIDLTEANALAFKYLNKFPELNNKHSHFDPEYIKNRDNTFLGSPDLVISNYAFSECSRDIQLLYYSKIIKQAHQFYFTYNNITRDNLNSEDFLRLASNDFNIHIEAEIRPAYVNYIFFGTRKH